MNDTTDKSQANAGQVMIRDIDLDAPALTKREALTQAYNLMRVFLADFQKYGRPDETDMRKAYKAADLLELVMNE